MLSAHAPLQHYPDLIKDEARKLGATAQVAGGVPAMCDGVTQGTPGMELSLFSRDVIAMATAVSLSHDMFDAALMLGVCDKIVPGLLIGALHFGHLPTVFVPAGPMTSGLSNSAKAKVREQAAQGPRRNQRLIAVEDDDGVAAGHRVTAAVDGAAGALDLQAGAAVDRTGRERDARDRVTARVDHDPGDGPDDGHGQELDDHHPRHSRG